MKMTRFLALLLTLAGLAAACGDRLRLGDRPRPASADVGQTLAITRRVEVVLLVVLTGTWLLTHLTHLTLQRWRSR